MNSSQSVKNLRIGAIARLSGIPVSTLRAWEQRYQAFEPAKTVGGQRLYAPEDGARARLLRQLCEAGQGIASIARLPLPALTSLAGQPAGTGPGETAPPLAIALVGASLCSRVDSPDWQARNLGRTVALTAAVAQLADLPRTGGETDLLIVQARNLQPGLLEALRKAQAQVAARRVIVLYSFARSTVLATASAMNLVLRREPVPDGELAQLILSQAGPGGLAAAQRAPRPRRYDDEALSRLSMQTSSILCECPRHVADLIGQLASFEQYSQDCLNETAQDAAVHALLREVAATSRTLFEDALDTVLAHNAAVAAGVGPARAHAR